MSWEDLKLEDKKELGDLRKLLYRAIVELGYVQEAPCNGGMCATPAGAEIVEEGMKLLGVADMGEDELPLRLVTA